MHKSSLAVAFATFCLVGQAQARQVPVPPIKGQSSSLKMQVVRYEGGTNGALTVEVINPSTAPAEFSAQGLYFIPEENANNAPQRLGAVGPIQIHSGDAWESKPQASVPAGGKVTLKLDVYCIDSHRRSPATGDKFHVAANRMPPKLTTEIHTQSGKAADSVGGYAAPAAKSAVQSEVWKARDKKWIKLEGEGNQERGK